MWRQLCNSLDILCHTSVSQQFIPHKRCNGMVCCRDHGFDRGTILAVVPFTYCASPAVACASPWGKRLQSALTHDYACRSDTACVAYSHANALTTAFTALAMQPHSPLTNYLTYIGNSLFPAMGETSASGSATGLPQWMMSLNVAEGLTKLSCCLATSAEATKLSRGSHEACDAVSGELRELVVCDEVVKNESTSAATDQKLAHAAQMNDFDTTVFQEKMRSVHELTTRVLEAMAQDMSANDLIVTVDALQRAHNLCSSRAVVFPHCEEVLGGAALVPFVDLINHDDGPDNVSVSLYTAATTQKLLCKAVCVSDDAIHRDRLNSKCPFFVVVRASEDIAAGEELVYSYVDRDSDCALYRQPLFWATRFGFIPPTVIARCSEK